VDLPWSFPGRGNDYPDCRNCHVGDFGPEKTEPIKMSTYECGMETVGDSWVQFKAQYYVFALAFLIFDVETVFLFPWAMSLNIMPLFVAVEGIIFILILLAGLYYIWQKGMLDWV
jgi:NADH:ubiquinone oxidoreductase subunit 3 (subunit A)